MKQLVEWELAGELKYSEKNAAPTAKMRDSSNVYG
jgi:hypothetical protein